MTKTTSNRRNSIDWKTILSSVVAKTSSEEPLYLQIRNHLKTAIENGSIPINSKLPTNRELSKLLEIDRSTAARAYLELNKSGYTESFVGRGTFARLPENNTEANQGISSQIIWSDQFSKASKAIFDLFQSDTANYSWPSDLISFAGGIPTYENYPTDEFEIILKEILKKKDSKDLFEYSPANGHPQLREQVIKHLEDLKMPVTEDELLIVSGSQQGIDIISSVFLDPGDYVALEDPTYLWAKCSFKSRQANCLPVPLTENGIRLDILESHLKRYKPKFLYVIPNFQNPTGLTMSLPTREKLVKLALQYQVPILEDDFVGDLRFEGERLPSLRSIDGGRDIVISQGTFSKALCPALRLGWIVAPKEVLSRLILAKRSSNLSTNSLTQIVLARFLEEGLFQEHLKTVRSTYKRRRDVMLLQLSKELLNLKDKNGTSIDINWSNPDGGMFIWLKMPDRYSTKDLLPHAQYNKVAYAPGHVCFNSSQNTQYLRLCFIQHDEQAIEEGISRLKIAIQSYIDEIADKTERQNSYVYSAEGHNFI